MAGYRNKLNDPRNDTKPHERLFLVRVISCDLVDRLDKNVAREENRAEFVAPTTAYS